MTVLTESTQKTTEQHAHPPRGRGFSRDRLETGFFTITRRVVIVLLLIITVFPFYYMFLLSIRPLGDVLRNPGALWPAEFDIGPYVEIMLPVTDGGQGFGSFMVNSLILAGGTVVATLLLAIPGSYAVSRLRFFGRRQVSVLFLAVYLFPSILLAVPLFVFFTRIGLRGALIAVIIVYISQTVAVSVYMLRNYFETIPVSLEESAALDGCSRLGTMWRISLPLAMPAIVSNGLWVFMVAWNEFLFALLFLVEDRDRWTVSLGLSQLTTGSLDVPTTVLMAACVLTTIPIILVFFVSERLLTEGLTSGAEKG
jgi:multiple sugar transport system permease protein